MRLPDLGHPVKRSALPPPSPDHEGDAGDEPEPEFGSAASVPRLASILAGVPAERREAAREILQRGGRDWRKALTATLEGQDDGRARAVLSMAAEYVGAQPRPERKRVIETLRKSADRLLGLVRGLGRDMEHEIPAWMGGPLWERQAGELSKGAGHKYLRRVATGNVKHPWRYFYTVSGGHGLGAHEEFTEGAAFALEHEGQKGHFHILEKSPDGKIRVKHDESGHEEWITPDALTAMLHRGHAKAIEAHTARLGADLSAVRQAGTARQKARLEAEAGKYAHTRHLVAGDPKVKRLHESLAIAEADAARYKRDGKLRSLYDANTMIASLKRQIRDAGGAVPGDEAPATPAAAPVTPPAAAPAKVLAFPGSKPAPEPAGPPARTAAEQGRIDAMAEQIIGKVIPAGLVKHPRVGELHDIIRQWVEGHGDLAPEERQAAARELLTALNDKANEITAAGGHANVTAFPGKAAEGGAKDPARAPVAGDRIIYNSAYWHDGLRATVKEIVSNGHMMRVELDDGTEHTLPVSMMHPAYTGHGSKAYFEELHPRGALSSEAIADNKARQQSRRAEREAKEKAEADEHARATAGWHAPKDRNEGNKRLKVALKQATGHDWSVRGSTGTGYGWVHADPVGVAEGTEPPEHLRDLYRMVRIMSPDSRDAVLRHVETAAGIFKPGAVTPEQHQAQAANANAAKAAQETANAAAVNVGSVVQIDSTPRRYVVTGKKAYGNGTPTYQLNALSGSEKGSAPSGVSGDRIALHPDQTVAFHGADAERLRGKAASHAFIYRNDHPEETDRVRQAITAAPASSEPPPAATKADRIAQAKERAADVAPTPSAPAAPALPEGITPPTAAAPASGGSTFTGEIKASKTKSTGATVYQVPHKGEIPADKLRAMEADAKERRGYKLRGEPFTFRTEQAAREFMAKWNGQDAAPATPVVAPVAGAELRSRAEALPDGMHRRDALEAIGQGDHAAAREHVEAGEAIPKAPKSRDEIERSANLWRGVLTGKPERRAAERAVVFGSIADPANGHVPHALRSAVVGINTALSGRVPPDLHNAIMSADPRKVVDLAEHIAREHIGTDGKPSAGPVAPGSPQGVVDWLNANRETAHRLLGVAPEAALAAHAPTPEGMQPSKSDHYQPRKGEPEEVANLRQKARIAAAEYERAADKGYRMSKGSNPRSAAAQDAKQVSADRRQRAEAAHGALVAAERRASFKAGDVVRGPGGVVGVVHEGADGKTRVVDAGSVAHPVKAAELTPASPAEKAAHDASRQADAEASQRAEAKGAELEAIGEQGMANHAARLQEAAADSAGPTTVTVRHSGLQVKDIDREFPSKAHAEKWIAGHLRKHDTTGGERGIREIKMQVPAEGDHRFTRGDQGLWERDHPGWIGGRKPVFGVHYAEPESEAQKSGEHDAIPLPTSGVRTWTRRDPLTDRLHTETVDLDAHRAKWGTAAKGFGDHELATRIAGHQGNVSSMRHHPVAVRASNGVALDALKAERDRRTGQRRAGLANGPHPGWSGRTDEGGRKRYTSPSGRVELIDHGNGNATVMQQDLATDKQVEAHEGTRAEMMAAAHGLERVAAAEVPSEVKARRAALEDSERDARTKAMLGTTTAGATADKPLRTPAEMTADHAMSERAHTVASDFTNAHATAGAMFMGDAARKVANLRSAAGILRTGRDALGERLTPAAHEANRREVERATAELAEKMRELKAPKAAGTLAPPAPAPATLDEQAAAEAPHAHKLGVRVSRNDVDNRIAQAAHAGTSHVPERRAEQERAGYVEHMENVARGLAVHATTPENKAALKEELERYRTGYLARTHAYLQAHGRVMSPMVTGPSKFPVRSNQKKGDTLDKRREELLDYSKRAVAAMHAKFTGPKTISSDRDDAVDALTRKIEQHKKLHATMKGVNGIVRGKGTDDEKVARIVAEHGMKEHHARELLKPDFAGRLGFADYNLTNNLAEIKRLEGRAAQVGREKSTSTAEHVFGDVRVVDSAEDNRIKLYYPGKPDGATIQKLKSNGFRWSPNEGAWQRFRNDATRSTLKHTFGMDVFNPPAAPAEPAATEPLQKSRRISPDLSARLVAFLARVYAA